MQQGTDEWRAARLGRVTASRIADVMAKTKTGPAASRKNYLAELVAERLTGQPTEHFQSAAMAHGTETEDRARAAYEWHQAVKVEQVGFVVHPTIEMAGASPDGLVGEHGMVEIKCPNTATHIDTLLNGKVPGQYMKQMQWQMVCADRHWCDFVSFDYRLGSSFEYFRVRVERDPAMAREITDEVVAFLNDVDQTVAALRKKYAPAIPATGGEDLAELLAGG